ncbi:MAG: complex I NDUFA9 subunit family protein, partial [Acidihalobacter sp.]
ADAFVSALHSPETHGRRYDLCGPRIYTLRELVRYTARLLGVRRVIIGLPDWAARLQANVFEYIPGKPFSRDNYRSLQHDSVCAEGTPSCATSLEAIAPAYLGDAEHQQRLQRLRESER